MTSGKYFICSTLLVAILVLFINAWTSNWEQVRQKYWPSIFRVQNISKLPAYTSNSVSTKHHTTDLFMPYHSSFLFRSKVEDVVTVITQTESGWTRDDSSCDLNQPFVKTELRSPAGPTPIYTHPTETDLFVSGSVNKGKVYERRTVTNFYNYLKDRPDIQFIDIGANIGVYGLTVARMGRRVLMIEPQLINVQKLCNSVRDGHFRDVYILHNALSSKRFYVSFTTDPKNNGRTWIRDVRNMKDETTYTVLLDDLLDVFDFKTVAIKMDVERHEPEVLHGANTFFTKVDVRYLMMEWLPGRKIPGKDFIIEFLTRHKMVPSDPLTDKPLDPDIYTKWPRDVLWKKSG